MPLPQRPLGSSGVLITKTGFGACAIGGGGWAFGWGPQDDAVSLATMRHALELGVNWTDMAAVYGLGHSEEVVGRLLRERTPSERPMAFTKCASLRRERSLASRVLASCFVLPVEAASLTGANKIALSSRAHPPRKADCTALDHSWP